VVVDPFDGPEIALLGAAVVAAVSSIVTAFLANRTRQHSRVVRSQVENEHQDAENPNLREDLDAKDRAAEARAKKTDRKIDRVLYELGEVKSDVGLLKEGWRTNRDDIDDLMDTATRERTERALWGPPAQTRRERRERNAR
jgi:hypothetical protein